MTLNFKKFESALEHLELQFENYSTSQKRSELTTLDREAIRESVIQRFEVCYDVMWKLAKRYLTQISGFPEVPNSPKPILRLSCDNKLFQAPVERLLKYADARIATSHDYSDSNATETVKLVSTFIEDASAFYEAISGKKWRKRSL